MKRPFGLLRRGEHSNVGGAGIVGPITGDDSDFNGKFLQFSKILIRIY